MARARRLDRALRGLDAAWQQLSDETEDDTASYLPESTESTEVVEVLDREFSAGETTIGLVVYRREGGLSAADERKIAADAKEIGAAGDEVPLTRPPSVPFTAGAPPDLVSPNGDVAYTVLTVPTDFDRSADWGKEVRDITGEDADGCGSSSPATSALRPTPGRSSPTSTRSCWRRRCSWSWSCSA